MQQVMAYKAGRQVGFIMGMPAVSGKFCVLGYPGIWLMTGPPLLALQLACERCFCHDGLSVYAGFVSRGYISGIFGAVLCNGMAVVGQTGAVLRGSTACSCLTRWNGHEQDTIWGYVRCVPYRI